MRITDLDTSLVHVFGAFHHRAASGLACSALDIETSSKLRVAKLEIINQWAACINIGAAHVISQSLGWEAFKSQPLPRCKHLCPCVHWAEPGLTITVWTQTISTSSSYCSLLFYPTSNFPLFFSIFFLHPLQSPHRKWFEPGSRGQGQPR